MLHLDHAATSHPKPEPVLAAVRHWFADLGVSAERGDGDRCRAVATAVAETRRRIGTLCGLPPQRVAFTSGATESLNLFLRGLLQPGDRVVTTAFEHSSVARPLRALEAERGIQMVVLEPDADGGLAPARVAAALAETRSRLLVFTHASNVTGTVLDAAAFCELARGHGALSLVDASQTAGALDLRVGADAVAASAHKSLLAPPGLGFLAVREGVPVRCVKQGGTGSAAAVDSHPEEWPEAFEAGTPNTPAIVGLGAALRWIEERNPLRLCEVGLALVDALAERLAGDRRYRLLRPAPGPRLPILSFLREDLDPAEVGAVLDAAGIHVRSGFCCAPWIHRHLGTERGGAVRVSPGPMITAADMLRVPAALAR